MQTVRSCGPKVANNKCGSFMRGINDNKVIKLLTGFKACRKESGQCPVRLTEIKRGTPFLPRILLEGTDGLFLIRRRVRS